MAILSSVIFVSGCQKDKTGEDFAITLRLSHVFNVNEELAQSIELVADRINKKPRVLFGFLLPIAYALFGASIVYFTFFDAGMPPDLVLQKFITSAASFPLLAIPFFVMAGSVMNYSGISKKLMQMAEVLTGHLIGGWPR